MSTEIANRIGFIGGSDIASILGVSPWKSAYQLWEEKMGQGSTDTTEQREKVLRRGKKLEPMVIEMLQEERDVWVVDRNQVFVDGEFPFLRAEIDFSYVIEPGPVDEPLEDHLGNGDVKTVHPFAAGDWGEQDTDEFPVYYAAQFQFGLMVNGRKTCMVAALIGADDLRVYQIPRDEELIALIRSRAVDFWRNHVVAGVPPPITTAEDAAKMLRKFDGLTVMATDHVKQALASLKEVKGQITLLQAQEARHELAVKLALCDGVPAGEAEPKKFAIVGDNGKPLATWNEQSRAGYTVGPASFRVLRIK